MNKTSYLHVGLLSVAIFSFSSCRGGVPFREFDCSTQEDAFLQVVSNEEELLLDFIPPLGPYPMGMVFTQDFINQVFADKIGSEIFSENFDLGFIQASFFEPLDKESTVVELADVEGCPTKSCVLVTVNFNLQMTLAKLIPVSGKGTTKFSVPLSIDARGEDVAVLVANFQDLQLIGKVELDLQGFEVDNIVSGLLRKSILQILQEDFGATDLLAFSSWQIGDNQIKLLARESLVDAEAQALIIAMQTNLALTAEQLYTQLPATLPGDKVVGFHIHPGLLLGVSKRMLVEGNIPRKYNDNGKPDENGNLGVTMLDMRGNFNLLEASFRVWRTDGDFCGYAEVVNPLLFSIEEGNISVAPTDDVKVVGGEGTGQVIADNEQLVEENKDLIVSFQESLAEQMGITVNYQDFNVDGSTIELTMSQLEMSAKDIAIGMDYQINN